MKKVKDILLALLLLSAFLFVVYATTEVADAMNSTYKEEMATETETNSEEQYENYTYVICDVTETNTKFFVAEMPNGELHEYYMVEDYPIDELGNPYFELVCFKVTMETQDNYSTYEIVAVR